MKAPQSHLLLFLILFQIQTIHFPTFGYIQNLPKIKKYRLKSQSMWFGGKKLLAGGLFYRVPARDEFLHRTSYIPLHFQFWKNKKSTSQYLNSQKNLGQKKIRNFWNFFGIFLKFFWNFFEVFWNFFENFWKFFGIFFQKVKSFTFLWEKKTAFFPQKMA